MLLISLLIAWFLSGIFRQFIPRLITWRNPGNKLLFLLPFVRPFYRIDGVSRRPVRRVFCTKRNSKQKRDSAESNASKKKDEDNADNIQALIEIGEAEGIIEEHERELIETMFEFSETRAGEIMTPRTEICALPINATVTQARDLIIEEKYSRLPVYRDRIENIEGVIYVRDLLNAWSEGKENESIENLLRPPLFVPETKSAAELLKIMQNNHVQLGDRD